MELEFLEDGHIYRFGEKEIPSVSEIIRFMAREVYKDADTFAMDQAARRGTRIHAACEELDRTGKCECDADIAGYIAGYRNFLVDYKPKWKRIEEIVWNREFNYAGRLDRLGEINRRDAIVDIKSTKKISKKHKLLYGVQIELYADAVDPCEDFDHYVLQLNENETYTF